MRRPSFEFLPNHSTELAGLRRRQIALLGLGVGVHPVEGPVPGCPIIDNPQPAALTGAGGRPTGCAQASGPLNDGPLFRAQHQRDVQLVSAESDVILAARLRTSISPRDETLKPYVPALGLKFPGCSRALAIASQPLGFARQSVLPSLHRRGSREPSTRPSLGRANCRPR